MPSFALTVEPEDLRIAPPQLLRHHVIGAAARAEPGGKRMPELVGREILRGLSG
jgi:hypothetical protein